MRSGMARVRRIAQFYLPPTRLSLNGMNILPLLCKHSPSSNGATRARQRTSDYSSLLIYRPRKDERLSWLSWLTYSGRFTHISGHPLAAGRAYDREISPVTVTDRRSTTVPHNQRGRSRRTHVMSPVRFLTIDLYLHSALLHSVSLR